MSPTFSFEAPSDEEFESSEPEEEDEEEADEEEGEGEEEDDDGGSIGPKLSHRHSQSPWDFASYSGSVAEERSTRSRTSVDFKISKARQQLSIHPSAAADDVEDESSESEPEEYRLEEEDDDAATNAVDSKSFLAPSDGASFHANSFMELNLSRPLLRACESLSYAKPTPIQTAAFALPTLERLLYRPKTTPAIRVVILTPTRELAVQVHSMIEKLAQFTDIRCCLIVGGPSTKVQEAALRSMPDILVATPGRMIDHLRNSMSVDLDDLAVFIIDEVDRLLKLGFSAEIHELVSSSSDSPMSQKETDHAFFSNNDRGG